jgi:hypothetical protein
MTDKEQIIIDGVDVRGCKDRYCDTNCGNTGLSCPDIMCENNANCYYKQLQRKEQECEKLKKIIENQRKEIYRHRHKQAELKERIKTLDGKDITVQITESEFAEYQSLKKQHDELISINNKRKDEIKTLKYMLYEERELRTETFKANFKIAKLERAIASNKSRFSLEFSRYRKVLEDIEVVINNLEKQDILTFPDFSLQENYKIIMKQCNEGYRQILNLISKAKGEEND